MSDPYFAPADCYAVMHSLRYGKNDWLEKVAAGKIKRPVHEVERVAHERDVLDFICTTYERKFEAEANKAKDGTA